MRSSPSSAGPSTGLKALAISVPDRVLLNDHWHENYPEVVAETEKRIWMWKKPEDFDEGSHAFNCEMAPFATDPFRGARKRRFLPPGSKALDLELDAARKALTAAEITVDDVDLLINTSFPPDTNAIGNAAFIARGLGLHSAAWNLETACSSALLAFQTAASLVKAGQYRQVLVVISCTYSRTTVEEDPISWGIGDAAIAMVVGEVEEGYGHLGSHSVHSGETCDSFRYDLEMRGENDEPSLRLRPGKDAARLVRELSEGYLQESTSKALDQAGLTIDDLDFCVFHTALAWYSPFCARVLGVDPERTINLYPIYANIGPALAGLNLFHAAQWDMIKKGDNVLVYSIGSVSSVCAVVMRWGDVALGAPPEDVTLEEYQERQKEYAELPR